VEPVRLRRSRSANEPSKERREKFRNIGAELADALPWPKRLRRSSGVANIEVTNPGLEIPKISHELSQMGGRIPKCGLTKHNGPSADEVVRTC
jgi:hypothetical protein